ncbi:tRNA (Guanine37-N(1)-) methyltransferase [Verrucomicrobium sp. GAS474]|uniref:tRNA (guanosine(37)-N1)-methyltransferase TrmD n=1 Tax=Verrucomicrobium sp. GAS474 TaxID=1882831 RepID=UPI00087DCDCE|nr:tRNA (guanosine(37)-N1)-methyltransferase TrmD [Verrucomicrobium sp. GAS474]SDU20873.1 tRNA (Guanine37-N(1)-) methyltransferase [Verrucomicrobium sp. GAS474]
MRIDVITLFPGMLEGALQETILGRAQQAGLVEVHLHQLRDYATDKHRIVDDRPYGGGPGMVLKCEPLFAAVEDVRSKDPRPGKVVLMSPGGKVFRQAVAQEWSNQERLILISGHYEGLDERIIEHLVDEEVSIGDYVLTNGTVAAMVVIDAVVRLLPGVLGNGESAGSDSFSDGFLEGPQYTRPPEFRGWKVPEILLSGDHAKIAAWRQDCAVRKTARVRPDLKQAKT